MQIQTNPSFVGWVWLKNTQSMKLQIDLTWKTSLKKKVLELWTNLQKIVKFFQCAWDKINDEELSLFKIFGCFDSAYVGLLCYNDRKEKDAAALSFVTINKFVINLFHTQVDGDGCVFVWKLPIPLSSKILERIMEKGNPLPSRIPDQPPACSYLSFCKEECQHYKINPEDVCSLRKETQNGNGVLNSESSHREASSFKYSISRLPRWAQPKGTGGKNVSYTSSEVSVLWLFLFHSEKLYCI